jgi:hypothetical protein
LYANRNNPVEKKILEQGKKEVNDRSAVLEKGLSE